MCEDVRKQDIVHGVASVRANVSQCGCDRESKVERDMYRVRTWSGCEKPRNRETRTYVGP